MQVFDIETKIASGQVEELIEQAKSELQLIPQYADWKVSFSFFYRRSHCFFFRSVLLAVLVFYSVTPPLLYLGLN